ncbi:hypothetical protein HYS91_04170 [Candidatus Daviesbacteria bacterium]|nr:hypothetical protein [Candidatus Daviesbacteria bacterium]
MSTKEVLNMATAEQGPNYFGLAPLESFKLFRGKYDSLVPTRDMREHSRVMRLYWQKAFPPIRKGKFSTEDIRDFYAKQDRAEVDALRVQERELQELVNKQEDERATSPEREVFLADTRELLYAAPIRHTDEFYQEVLQVLDEQFIRRWRRSNLFLTEEAILTDPYRVGGFFHTAFAAGIERVVFSYNYISAHNECPMPDLEKLGRQVRDEVRQNLGLPYKDEKKSICSIFGHDEAQCQLDKQALQSRVVVWREQFLGLFGEEPLLEVSHNSKSWKES